MHNILVIAPTTANIYKVIVDGFKNYEPEIDRSPKVPGQFYFVFPALDLFPEILLNVFLPAMSS